MSALAHRTLGNGNAPRFADRSECWLDRARSTGMPNAQFNLVILTTNLLREGDLPLACELRESDNIPLMDLADRDNEADKILGLGADDTITKPFTPRGVTIRVRNC